MLRRFIPTVFGFSLLNGMVWISVLYCSLVFIGAMQLTLFASVSLQSQPALSNPMSIANPISKFASAPKPWASFTNSYATIPSALLIRFSMNFSLPTRFSSHIFDYIVYEDSDDDSYYSDSNISALYSDDSTYFSWILKDDVCAIPMLTQKTAAQRLKRYTKVWDAPTPAKDSLHFYSGSRKPPRAARTRRPAWNFLFEHTANSRRNSCLSRGVVILNPVTAAESISIMASPDPLKTARCQFTPILARSTKLSLSGIGGSGTGNPSQLRRSRTNALQPFIRYTYRRVYSVKFASTT